MSITVFLTLFTVLISLLIGISGFFVLKNTVKEELIENRISKVINASDSVVKIKNKQKSESLLISFVLFVGKKFSDTGILNTKTLDSIKSAVQVAGFRDNTAYALLIGAKIILSIGLPVVFLLLAMTFDLPMAKLIISACCGMVLGLLSPEWALRAFRRRYQNLLRAGMADALDLLVICVDSGLGLESAIARVALEMRETYPLLSHEFHITSQDIQINPDIEASIRSLATRTKVDSIQRLANTLIQSLVYGTPLASSLHTLAGELRHQTLVDFEERASKLSTKMTVPMILFILPALIVVVIGPSIGHLENAFAHLGK